MIFILFNIVTIINIVVTVLLLDIVSVEDWKRQPALLCWDNFTHSYKILLFLL